MKPLSEYIFEAIQKNLSDFQKGLLIALVQSATGEQGYETAIGSQNSMAALHQLQIMGFVIVNGKSVGLTSSGRQAALQNNLIDETGAITDEGNRQLDSFTKNKLEFIKAH